MKLDREGTDKSLAVCNTNEKESCDKVIFEMRVMQMTQHRLKNKGST